MSSWTCALSGEPLTADDEVCVTPSGRLVRKSLLLTTLSENGSKDPFEPERPLSEDDLILLNKQQGVLPPRPHGGTSMGSLLSMANKEYNSLLLELYETRKTLEETRQELSLALYQNDAATRVVARLAQERDAARQQLQEFKEAPQSSAEQEQPTTAVEEEPEAEEPEKKKRKIEKDKDDSNNNKIPAEELDIMVDTWKVLSKQRKKQSKSNAPVADVANFAELDSKAWHKTRSKAGILSMAMVDQTLATAGRDGQILLYNASTKTLAEHCIKSTKSDLGTVQMVHLNETHVVAAGTNGNLALYTVAEAKLTDKVTLVQDKKSDGIVHVEIHPTGQHIVASTRSGKVIVMKIQSDDTITILADFQANDDEELQYYSCGALHPDGLIYCAGTSSGKVHIWDLKSQSMASTLDCGSETEVVAIAFSNNGYHIVTSLKDDKVLVWDLRKQKIVATLNDNDEEKLQDVSALAFDAMGKHLAFGGTKGMHVTTVKEWGITAKLASECKSVTGICWTSAELITCSNVERHVKFYGIAQDEKMDEE